MPRPIRVTPWSPTALAFVAAAEERARGLSEVLGPEREGFVGSDPHETHAALATLARSSLPRGGLFCEWGSGLGVVAGLAADLGFESTGIEVQPALVETAEELAAEFSLEVVHARGTIVPPSFADDPVLDRMEAPWWHGPAPDGHAELGIEPTDVDIFFAYPWPGERPAFEALFAHVAGEGALLLTYEDGRGIGLLRKILRKSTPLTTIWDGESALG